MTLLLIPHHALGTPFLSFFFFDLDRTNATQRGGVFALPRTPHRDVTY
jgi:hypothetical protein